jgi:hypothetical protein
VGNQGFKRFGEETVVLGIIGSKCLFRGMVSVAPLKFSEIKTREKIRNLSTISSHHPISYQGGGDYRGIYDTGLKRGFYGVYRPFIECPLQER